MTMISFSSRRANYLVLAGVMAWAFFVLSGCITHPPRNAANLDPATVGVDKFETAEGSLPVDVIGFSWAVYNDGAHLKVTGVVRNNGPEPLQAVALVAQIMSDKGEGLGVGRSFINPTYLPPGKEGSFEITIMLTGNKPPQNLYLITRASVLK